MRKRWAGDLPGFASANTHILLCDREDVRASRVREDNRRRPLLRFGIKHARANGIFVLVGVVKRAIGIHGSPNEQPRVLLKPVAIGPLGPATLVTPLPRAHSVLHARFPRKLLQLGVLGNTCKQGLLAIAPDEAKKTKRSNNRRKCSAILKLF